MRVEHWAKDVGSVDSTFSESEALQALEDRFRRSQAWREHEAFHEQRGEQAVLLVHRDEGGDATPSERVREEIAPMEHHSSRRSTLSGGCQCQSPSVRLLLGDDGSVKNEPEAFIETNSYGVVAEETTTYSGGAGSAAPNYLPSAPTGSLYKP